MKSSTPKKITRRLWNLTNVLIVDDNEAILHVQKRVLEKQGFIVNVSLTGKEAIEETTKKFYDLVIIDLNLPDMNGLNVYKMISASSPQTKKIILTGLPPERNKETTDEEQIVYLLKPLSAEDLLKAIKKVLHKSK